MIHYRISPTKDNQLTNKVYRSFKSVLKDNSKIQGSIYAYASRYDAKTEQTENRLNLKYELPFLGANYVYGDSSNKVIKKLSPFQPKALKDEDIKSFLCDVDKARSVNPARCNASRRDYFRGVYEGIYLFGFDKEGRAISSRLFFNISCNYNRTKAPIYINNKLSNKRGLLKYFVGCCWVDCCK